MVENAQAKMEPIPPVADQSAETNVDIPADGQPNWNVDFRQAQVGDVGGAGGAGSAGSSNSSTWKDIVVQRASGNLERLGFSNIEVTGDGGPADDKNAGADGQGDQQRNADEIRMHNGWTFTRNADGTYTGRSPSGEEVTGLKDVKVMPDGSVSYSRPTADGGHDRVFVRQDGQRLTATYDRNGSLTRVEMPGPQQNVLERQSDGTWRRSWRAPDGRRVHDEVRGVNLDASGTVSWMVRDMEGGRWVRTITLDGRDDGGRSLDTRRSPWASIPVRSNRGQ